MEITRVKKRDGRIEKFEKKKIINAIFRAVVAVGGTDRETVELLADKVVEYLKDLNKEMPSVEDVQDAVEKVLIEQGHAKTAKAYILYREKRAELRKEKTRILEKDDIDEVDKKFDVNSLRVLKSRYLEKDDKGKLIETPKQLFTRVAVHAALPSLFYDKRFFVKDCSATKHHDEDFNPETHENKYSIGKYKLNRFHLKGLKKIYDRHNKEGKINVTWSEFFDCLKNKGFDDYEKEIGKFFEIMTSRKFMPNTPAIANFGSHLGMGSACFVLDVKDSMDGIMGTLTATAIIHKAGGGTGFNFSKLRPEGDFISTTKGVSSGPLSFMRLFDTMTEVVKQGGIRRGANMGIMNSNHPDIEKFITSKQGNKALRNFNISVLMMPDFWEHYKNGTSYPLINPRNGSVVRTVDSRRLFDQIVYQAWESGEPGVIFHDRINRHNPFLESLGPIVTTNPCGEVLLYPDEPCNLGSINVWAFAKDNKEGKPYFDWDDLKDSVRTATRLLDNVIDVNQWPLPQIEQMALSTRKVGLGVMGVGDLLYELELPYNTEKARDFMEELMEFINYYSKVESIELARNRGSLPYYEKSFYTKGEMPLAGFYDKDSWHFDWDEISRQVKEAGIRNGFTTVIAPTGSISMIAGCSSGIEPVYSLVYEKNVKVGSFYYVNPVFEKAMKKMGIFDENLMEDILSNRSSVKNISYIPPQTKRIFVTAMDITPEDHIRAMASFQKWVDSSISKTINFPAEASVEDMRKGYVLAYRLGCKGVTVYRDSSIQDQVLVAATKESEKRVETAQHTYDEEKQKERLKVEIPEDVSALTKHMMEKDVTYTDGAGFYTSGDTNGDTTYTNGYTNGSHEMKTCPSCNIDLNRKEGCSSCPECGWGLCS